MVHVEALQAMEHNGRRARGARFYVSPQQAEKLRDRRLVKVLGGMEEAANPRNAAGTRSSVLPAAPASRQKTAKPSGRGGRRKKAEGSS